MASQQLLLLLKKHCEVFATFMPATCSWNSKSDEMANYVSTQIMDRDNVFLLATEILSPAAFPSNLLKQPMFHFMSYTTCQTPFISFVINYWNCSDGFISHETQSFLLSMKTNSQILHKPFIKNLMTNTYPSYL